MANWGNILSKGNVEDRRSLAPVALGGGSIAGVALILIFNFLSGGNLEDALYQLQNVQVESQQSISKTVFDGEDDYEVFASKVLGSNNDMWTQLFSKSGKTYRAPKLVLFRTSTKSACGGATSDIGPHYCPTDRTIYLDETFFDELTKRYGAQGGDVAEAYVIAHEVGHHAQNEFGIMDEVANLQSEDSANSNSYSIKLELQADCFSGLWANSIKNQNVFTPGEFAEAMDAAEAVGDDRIQKNSSGRVNPETWTHGSAADRKQWLNKGYETGSLSACNTF